MIKNLAQDYRAGDAQAANDGQRTARASHDETCRHKRPKDVQIQSAIKKGNRLVQPLSKLVCEDFWLVISVQRVRLQNKLEARQSFRVFTVYSGYRPAILVPHTFIQLEKQ